MIDWRLLVSIMMSSVLMTQWACRKIDDQGFKSYVIKEGKHRSTVKYKRTWKNVLKFQSIFDESAIYTTEDSTNQADINKLYGVSDCNEHHMQSSIRIGWRWYNDNLELLWFKHFDGNFSFGKIKNVNLNEVINCSIELGESKYIVSVDGDTVETDRPCGLNQGRYYLWPYFGGNEKAPHDIKIKIKEENP
jgi:hypothetical protein